jgi:hypothetical protein
MTILLAPLTAAELDAFGNQLPTTATEEVTKGDRDPTLGTPVNGPFGLPSYFDTTLTLAGFLNGRYDAWCIRTDQNLLVEGLRDSTGIFNSNVYSSYETIPAGVLQTGETQPINIPTPDPYINKLQQLNWLFNNVTEAANVSGIVYIYEGVSYTLGDVQLAIWKILGNPIDNGDRGTL